MGQEPLVRMDGLEGKRTALFDSRHECLMEPFKADARLCVQLRFRPEWPAMGTQSATFRLIGFTKAYAELADCR